MGMRTLCCFLLLIGVAGALHAHPHIFIDAELELVFSQGSPVAVRTHWKFDRFFSNSILLDFAGTMQGPLNAQQIESIRTGAFENLVNYNFFMQIWVDGQHVTVDHARNFSADVEDGQMIYSFEVDLPQSNSSSMIVGVYDDSYYCAVGYADEQLAVQGDAPAVVHADLREDSDHAYYFNTISPLVFFVEW